MDSEDYYYPSSEDSSTYGEAIPASSPLYMNRYSNREDLSKILQDDESADASPRFSDIGDEYGMSRHSLSPSDLRTASLSPSLVKDSALSAQADSERDVTSIKLSADYGYVGSGTLSDLSAYQPDHSPALTITSELGPSITTSLDQIQEIPEPPDEADETLPGLRPNGHQTVKPDRPKKNNFITTISVGSDAVYQVKPATTPPERVLCVNSKQTSLPSVYTSIRSSQPDSTSTDPSVTCDLSDLDGANSPQRRGRTVHITGPRSISVSGAKSTLISAIINEPILETPDRPQHVVTSPSQVRVFKSEMTVPTRSSGRNLSEVSFVSQSPADVISRGGFKLNAR